MRNIYILLAVALLLLISFPVYIKEDSASAVTGTANSSSTSLTLTTSNTSANVTVTPNSANGTFAMSSTAGEAQFGVTTNNYTGYELRIKADDDNGNLVNIDNGITHTISSIPSSITKSSFDTTTYNNRWGYKPSKYVSNNVVIDNTGDSALFLPSPTTLGTVLDHTTTPNTTANNYTIALGIRVDNNTYSGSYTKTFTLVATANPTTYTINYNKNTTDTVSNLPSTSTAGSTTATSITLPNTVPTRAHYSFLGWCSTTTTTSNGIDSCSGTVYNPNGAGTNLTYGLDQTTANTTTLYAMWKIDAFVQTTQVRYEDENGAWGNYSTVDTQILDYGSSYSWSTSQITGFNTTIYQSASVSSYTVTEAHTNYVSIYRKTYTCYIQSRDQNAGGDYTGYTARVNTTLRYGQTCSWSSPADTTYQAASYSATITNNISQSLNRNRQVYTLTINRNTTYIQSVSGAGSYRAGQTVSISATASSGNEFTSWSQTAGTTGSFANANSSSTYFYMPASNATVYANGKSSCAATISGYMQDFKPCSNIAVGTVGTLTDSRDGEVYNVGKLADGKFWLLDNLRLDLVNTSLGTLQSRTNASNTTLNYLKNGGGTASDKYATAGVTNNVSGTWYSIPRIDASRKDNTQSYGNGSGKFGIYYNYCAASAGSYCYGNGDTSEGSPSGNATEDICPAGWRMPTGGEYSTLSAAYPPSSLYDAANFNNAFHAVRAGSYENNSFINIGGYGWFWSSTYATSQSMGSLYTMNMLTGSSLGGNRYFLYSVRCVLK